MNERDLTEESQPEEHAGWGELAVGLALLLLSGYVFVTSFYIPVPERWATAPGMLPMFLGGSLFIMAAVITIDAVRRGAFKSLKAAGRQSGKPSEAPIIRTVLAICGIAVFYFGLLRYLYFEIAAALFLLYMTQMFWKESTLTQRVLISIGLPFVITGAFRGVFGIPVPGESNIVETIIYMLPR